MNTDSNSVRIYSSQGMFTLVFLFKSKVLFVHQFPDCPTYHALVVIVEQSFQHMPSNDSLMLISLDKTRSSLKSPYHIQTEVT